MVLTICGATGSWFAWRPVWPALRSGGRWAAIGAGLLALAGAAWIAVLAVAVGRRPVATRV